MSTRSVLLGVAGAAALASLAACGSSPRDMAMKRRETAFAASPGDGRMAIVSAARPERVRAGDRTALGLSSR